MSGWCARAVLALGLCLRAAAVPVPPFSLKCLDGSLFKLEEHLGRQVIVLDFWATWCGPCTRALKKLQELHERRPGVLVLAIAIDDGRSMAQVDPFVEGRGFTFTVLRDPDASVFRMFNPGGGVPFTAVLDLKGSMVYSHSGYLAGDERALDAAVAQLGP